MGAGIIGCAIAYELVSRGATVRVIDPRRAGAGATQASAGTLAPYIEGHSTPLRSLGVRSLALFDGFVHRVTADAGIDVEYARTGTLQVALGERDAASLRAKAAELSAAGAPHRWLDAGDVASMEPGLAPATAGLFVADHGLVAVQALTGALERALLARGTGWSTDRQAPREALSQADAVIIASGAWAGEPVRPVRGQLVHLRLETPPVGRIVWGSDCYAVPWRDGSLLVGATVEDVGFDESSTPEAVRWLADAAAMLIPAARGARIHDVRVGLRPGTPDGLPVVGRSSTMPGVFYATGHYRTGVLLAPLTATLVADLVLDGREDAALSQVRPDRFGL